MSESDNFTKLGDLLKNKQTVKGPAYPWQDLALKIISDLNVPAFKKSAVFKVCRDLPQQHIVQALIDTKELCQTGQKWKYFFKITSGKHDEIKDPS
ncbi:MAG: hypothetical protein WCV73_05060 [Patescibacteria group bacterium]|jgi:hypothetical protein